MFTLKKVAVLGAMAVAGQLYAQPVAPTDPVDPAAPADLTVDATVSARVQISPQEMTQRAAEFEVQIKLDVQHVNHLQAMARKEKDVIKLACVNDKYIRLKAEANIFDNARLQLTGSLDKEERFTTYDTVSGAADRVHKAREEAERCAGEPDLGPGESQNGFTSPDIVDDPTKGSPFDNPGTLVEPPGYASPYS
ncbi:MAG: hypothetical protein H0X17_10300 [Deltaproteobacteria bacterium]|nr:hypothetical protein [Deltaproteobacteria bacterium]